MFLSAVDLWFHVQGKAKKSGVEIVVTCDVHGAVDYPMPMPVLGRVSCSECDTYTALERDRYYRRCTVSTVEPLPLVKVTTNG